MISKKNKYKFIKHFISKIKYFKFIIESNRLKTPGELHKYQIDTINIIENKKKCAVFADVGMGKTVISLTAIRNLQYDFFITNTLIIAPKKVANTTWKQEAQKWTHLKDLKIQICTGSAKERLTAVNSKADIHVINVENIDWLIRNVPWKWQSIIVDESSLFKNRDTKRFKALKCILYKLKSIVILTGTPISNGYMDLWAQMYLVDMGQRLGRIITDYRRRYFYQMYENPYKWHLRVNAEEEILNKIKDICVILKNEDYLDLPKRVDIYERLELPKELLTKYKKFEKEFVLEINEKTIETPSAGALANKLLQFSNGAIYNEDKTYEIIHNLKIERLKEIIEDNPRQNFLISYNFKHDKERLLEAIPGTVVMDKDGKLKEKWDNKEIKFLLVHPASSGRGLNLQAGGNVIVWFGLNWSLELYYQLNGRLLRQGQKRNHVKIIHLVLDKTLDDKVLKALELKIKTQDGLFKFLKNEYTKQL